MNRDNAPVEGHPSLDKRAEAAAWFARLRGPGRTAEIDRGFRTWLQADKEHARAFELLTERLEVAERLSARPVPRHWRRERPQRRISFVAMASAAAMLGLVFVASILYSNRSGITTAVGEQRILTLKDGTRVYLNTDTRVLVRYSESSRQVELDSGEALFEVTRQLEQPFVVIAGDRQVTALGTTFLVRRDPSRLSVTLMEGRVSVTQESSSPASPSPSILEPGQRLMFKPDQPPRIDKPPLDKVAAWRQGQVALDDMPLSEAVVEMNRYSTTRVVVERPEAGTVRVAGFFRTGDSLSFARAVAETYRLQVIERADEIVLAGLPQG